MCSALQAWVDKRATGFKSRAASSGPTSAQKNTTENCIAGSWAHISIRDTSSERCARSVGRQARAGTVLFTGQKRSYLVPNSLSSPMLLFAHSSCALCVPTGPFPRKHLIPMKKKVTGYGARSLARVGGASASFYSYLGHVAIVPLHSQPVRYTRQPDARSRASESAMYRTVNAKSVNESPKKQLTREQKVKREACRRFERGPAAWRPPRQKRMRPGPWSSTEDDGLPWGGCRSVELCFEPDRRLSGTNHGAIARKKAPQTAARMAVWCRVAGCMADNAPQSLAPNLSPRLQLSGPSICQPLPTQQPNSIPQSAPPRTTSIFGVRGSTSS